MNDEAESSRAALRRHARSPDLLDDMADMDMRHDTRDHANDAEERRLDAKERRLDAKRKRIRMLGDLLRELDLAVYLELLALYHLDCSFFWFALRALAHGSLLTPVADTTTLQRPPDEPRPFLPVVAGLFVVNLVLHMLYAAPSAGEATRGYLHGGLMMDLIGQQGPTSKWKLGALDLCILVLQLVMVSVHVKRRHLKKQLAQMSAAEPSSDSAANTATSDAARDNARDNAAATATSENAARGQDADDEERGLLHRSDTMSDMAADPEEEDALPLSPSETGRLDALDLLTSGQCVILSAGLVDTIWRENDNYRLFRQTRSESSGLDNMPETLRRLNTLRTRFGVGGG